MPATSPTKSARPTVDAIAAAGAVPSADVRPGAFDRCADAAPQRTLRRAVEGRDADRRAREGDEPASRPELGETAERPAEDELAVADGKRRQAREEAEVDAERIAARGPRLDAVARHAGELRGGVHERGCSQEALVLVVGRDELEPPERGEACDGGPHAESLGVGPPRPQPECAADGAPRVERTEDVTQQCAERDQPDPEDDVHEGGERVRGRDLAAREARVDEAREQGHADCAAGDVERARDAQQDATTGLLEPRRAPQRSEGDEGDHEHRGRAPAGQPAGHREIGPAGEPVRRRGRRERTRGRTGGRHEERETSHGATRNDAIWVPECSSSTSKTPSSVARNDTVAVRPGSTSFLRS